MFESTIMYNYYFFIFLNKNFLCKSKTFYTKNIYLYLKKN